MAGWTDAEKEELDAVIRGTRTANAARQAGKFAPHGIVSTVMSAGAGHALMPGVGEVAVPAVGLIARLVGDRMTRMAAERLGNVIKARSPLGRQTSINAAVQSALSPQASRPSLAATLTRAGLPSPTPQIPLRQIQGVMGAPAEQEQERPWWRDNEPDQGASGKSHGGRIAHKQRDNSLALKIAYKSKRKTQ